LRIGILGTRGIPNRYGGFEECAEKLALGLVQKGHQVWVYNSHNHEYQQSEWQDVQIIHCNDPEKKLGTAGQFIYDLNCINDARHRHFDVVLQLGYTSSSVWWWRWPRRAINIVNMDGLEWKRSKYSAKVRAFLKKAEAWAARHGDILISDSPGIRQHLLETYQKASTYIPYGASVYEQPDINVLKKYGLQPDSYHLLIARMEPENNIEMILRGYLESEDTKPFLVIGNTGNAFGNKMKELFDKAAGIRFLGAIYDASVINALRYYSHLYYHGHSVGGTNPSLLEAMACNALIAAHANTFNRAILGEDSFYFSTISEVAGIIHRCREKSDYAAWIAHNRRKIIDTYNWPAVVHAYEQVMLDAYYAKTKKP
jgi:hypothetical protein